MPYIRRTLTCPDCGDSFTERANRRRVPRCPVCAIAHAAEASRQLHARSGPLYDRWVRGNLAAAQRMLSSTGPVECP